MTGILDALAMLVAALAGLYFLSLAAVSFAAPARASGFLMGFASSAAAHYAELSIRVVVGSAFIVIAPFVPIPPTFAIFGWVLVGTTAALFLVPWQWHRRFAVRAVSQALRYLPLVALASLLLGAFVLWSMVRAVA